MLYEKYQFRLRKKLIDSNLLYVLCRDVCRPIYMFTYKVNEAIW